MGQVVTHDVIENYVQLLEQSRGSADEIAVIKMRLGKGEATSMISSGSQTKHPTCGVHGKPLSLSWAAAWQCRRSKGVGGRSVSGLKGVGFMQRE